MIKVKNPNQLNIFDPWDFLTPKRREMLDGLAYSVSKYCLRFLSMGSASISTPYSADRQKELYSMLDALIYQQTFDFTDEETILQYAFNIQWHYSLNISEETYDAKYISLKTLWNNRNIVAQNNLEDDIFKAGTDLAGAGFQR